jgi:hypothetical protein
MPGRPGDRLSPATAHAPLGFMPVNSPAATPLALTRVHVTSGTTAARRWRALPALETVEKLVTDAQVRLKLAA